MKYFIVLVFIIIFLSLATKRLATKRLVTNVYDSPVIISSPNGTIPYVCNKTTLHYYDKKCGTCIYNIYGCCRDMKLAAPTTFDIRKLLLSLKDKRLSFVGDSMARQTLDALVLRLQDNDDITMVHPTIGNTWNNHVIYRWHVSSPYNVTIQFVQFYRVTTPSIPEYPPLDRAYDQSVNMTVVRDILHNSDHVVVNLGLHHATQPGFLFKYILHELLDEMAADLSRHRHKKHVYRLTFPQHFKGGDYWLFKERIYGITSRHWTDVMARQIIDDDYDNIDRLSVLDYYDFMKDRWELHTIDGSHWCYLPSLWDPFWEMLSKTFDGRYM